MKILKMKTPVATENEKEKINKDMSEEDIITALLNSNC